MMDLSALLAFLPEPARTYVVAALYAFLATQIVASAIVAVTPAWAFKWRPLRALSWYAHLAPRDASGTFKLPFRAPAQPGAMEDLARLDAAARKVVSMTTPGNLGASVDPELAAVVREMLTRAAKLHAPPSRPTQAPPPPSDPQRGTVRVGVLVSLSGAVLVATLAGALLTACPGPVTPVDGGPAVTPSSWASTARVVITTLRWALPAVRAITDLTVAEPGRTQVARALDAAAQATDRLHGAVDAYEARGGDRCAARAAVGGLQVALVGVAQVLADNGVALGTTLERIVDAVASIADALIPACDADAGWASAGDGANARLRAIAEGARARGVTLRRVLDDLRPMDAGAL